MSVIVKGMEIPKSCSYCEVLYDMIFCSITGTHVDFETMDIKRSNDCPLKSVDGLIEKIRKMPNDNPSYWHTCDVVDREDLIEIIKEYCEVR